MATRATKLGRKSGGYNRGFFFRTGRGWCANDGRRAVLLRNTEGEPLRDRDTPATAVREAHARFLMGLDRAVVQAPEADQVTVLKVCELYLSYCQATGAAATYRSRADTLFDFCSGLPAAFRNKSGAGNQKTKKGIDAARIHPGYGNLLICDLMPLHVDQWFQAHPSWDGCRRTKVQALKRAINYCVGAGVLTRNPIKGFKTQKSGMRMTYLTPVQEAACYEYANAALAIAIKVCIRTGARYGSEFAKLTAKHVQSTDKGMEWRFSEKESKNHKPRVVRIPNSDEAGNEVIEIVQRQLERYPTGPIFRNSFGNPWTRPTLGGAFTRLRKRLAKKGVVLDDDACMYSCRHTYAKRALSGYWAGKPSTIERLAALMGNTREVCWEHYAGWCDAYTDPLWESA
jgi:hypothetical protein